jgi:tRNA threonylcarbamoyladenosine biosynthesis protein TsaE
MTLQKGQWTSRSPKETFELGRNIGQNLSGGEVILLNGPLGAGKTILVKGIASALDLDPEEITSPSFTLVNEYEGPIPLYHLDLYRLDPGASSGYQVGLEEILLDESAVCIVEWGERLAGFKLPSSTWKIRIEGDGEDPRQITLTPH